jgi:hypothetical protein
MNAPQVKKASAVSAAPATARTAAAGAASASSSLSRRWRRSCAPGASSISPDRKTWSRSDLVFFLLLISLAASALPSLLFCSLKAALWGRGAFASGAIEFHLPAQNLWDGIFSLQASMVEWVSRWNSPVTLVATGIFIGTLVRPRWRRWTLLALLPYALLLCADFALHGQSVLLP